MASNVSGVYLHVIDDVVSKVRDEFINSGTGESVLSELQAIWEMKMLHCGLWEMKMLQCGVISGTAERSTIPKSGAPITPVHDLNMPYEGPVEEYETPTAEMLFPPTPAQTPLPGTAEQSFNIPTAPSDYSPLNDIRNGVDGQSGRQSPYMHPFSPWVNQRQVGVDVNIAYVESNDEANRGAPHQPMTQDFLKMSAGKRKRDDQASQVNSSGFMPQQDGSEDVMIEFFLPKENLNKNSSARETEISGSAFDKEARGIPMLPQQDGVNDDYNDMFHHQGAGSEGYGTPAEHVEYQAGTPAVGTPRPAKTEGVDDDEPPLNEDDDDDDDLDDLDEGEEEPNTQHLVLAQFDKVTRTKSRWKCTLKDGIMHINNRDILFNKASGEFEF